MDMFPDLDGGNSGLNARLIFRPSGKRGWFEVGTIMGGVGEYSRFL